MKKSKIELYQGYFFDGDTTKEWQFASDGTRKPLKEEFRDILKQEFGDEVDTEDIDDVYKITEVYDYTKKKVYKIVLKKK